MTQLEKIEIDRITRVIEAQGWIVTSVDTRGVFIEISIQKTKPEQ